jgi:hypothetical protein
MYKTCVYHHKTSMEHKKLSIRWRRINWQEGKADPRWRGAMLEEMDALDKNNTWILTTLPANKEGGEI